MPLQVGARLGHYTVSAKLGEGGMGEVWEATDTKLNRQVALKILPEAFAADPDRLARFQREAQLLASLNHPGIVQIHGIQESEGTRALVELVEGQPSQNAPRKGPSHSMEPSVSRLEAVTGSTARFLNGLTARIMGGKVEAHLVADQ